MSFTWHKWQFFSDLKELLFLSPPFTHTYTYMKINIHVAREGKSECSTHTNTYTPSECFPPRMSEKIHCHLTTSVAQHTIWERASISFNYVPSYTSPVPLYKRKWTNHPPTTVKIGVASQPENVAQMLTHIYC